MGIAGANLRVRRQATVSNEEINGETSKRALKHESIWRNKGHAHPLKRATQLPNGMFSAARSDSQIAEDPEPLRIAQRR
jgi:hypothetical protein